MIHPRVDESDPWSSIELEFVGKSGQSTRSTWSRPIIQTRNGPYRPGVRPEAGRVIYRCYGPLPSGAPYGWDGSAGSARHLSHPRVRPAWICSGLGGSASHLVQSSSVAADTPSAEASSPVQSPLGGKRQHLALPFGRTVVAPMRSIAAFNSASVTGRLRYLFSM